MLSAEQRQILEGTQGRLVVAYSGGADSHVLLHFLTKNLDASVEALHINHRLNPASDDWQCHCESVCDALNVPLTSFTVSVDQKGSLETSARRARYQAFEAFLEPGDCLLLGHHQDDQTETLLMNLFSGRGQLGLLGMPEQRQLGVAELYRPLLKVRREEILDYANRHDLRWIEDPSNQDTIHTRNKLRHDVIPVLTAQWPGLAEQLQSTWERTEKAMKQMAELAELDLSAAQLGPGVLDAVFLGGFSQQRLEACLSLALTQMGYKRVPGGALLKELRAVLFAKSAGDYQAGFDLGSLYLQRYRDRVYLNGQLTEDEFTTAADGVSFAGGRISADIAKGRGCNLPAAQLEIRPRQGGESIYRHGHHHTLKNLFQEQGVPPHVRGHIPLLWLDDTCIGFSDIPPWGISGVISDKHQVSPDEHGSSIGWWPPGTETTAQFNA